MRSSSYSGQFKRDVKLAQKRGKDRGKLRDVIDLLLADQPLPRALADHPLKGGWRPRRDIYIEPDWLLTCSEEDEVVRFDRTGTHSDLFGK